MIVFLHALLRRETLLYRGKISVQNYLVSSKNMEYSSHPITPSERIY